MGEIVTLPRTLLYLNQDNGAGVYWDRREGLLITTIGQRRRASFAGFSDSGPLTRAGAGEYLLERPAIRRRNAVWATIGQRRRRELRWIFRFRAPTRAGAGRTAGTAGDPPEKCGLEPLSVSAGVRASLDFPIPGPLDARPERGRTVERPAIRRRNAVWNHYRSAPACELRWIFRSRAPRAPPERGVFAGTAGDPPEKCGLEPLSVSAGVRASLDFPIPGPHAPGADRSICGSRAVARNRRPRGGAAPAHSDVG